MVTLSVNEESPLYNIKRILYYQYKKNRPKDSGHFYLPLTILIQIGNILG
jgi:hypothetical protein